MTLTTSSTHAVILAAGLGTRLRPMTADRPKPLIEVHGTPILHNALRNLAIAGIRNATIVVGYRKDLIERACGAEFAGVKLTYAPSEVFDKTGSAYSLWLARETLCKGGDVVLIEGDVFFESALLQRVLRIEGDVTAVDAFDDTITGSAALVSPTGHVSELRMNQSINTIGRDPLYKTANVYRFTAETLQRCLVPALDRLIASGDRKSYIEQFLAPLLQNEGLVLRSAQCSGLRWYEIDSEADLRRAEALFAPPPSVDSDFLQPALG